MNEQSLNSAASTIVSILSGMSAASFSIFWMKIKIEWHSVVFCSAGGIFGIVFGRNGEREGGRG